MTTEQRQGAGQTQQRIAIIGSGIAGLTAAHLLSRRHHITLFEANDYIGGHTHTVPVEMAGVPYQVDTGFIVCNDRNYPNFLKLMQQLGVELQPTEMSFSVRNSQRDLEYNGHNLNTLFAQRQNLLRPEFYRLIRDILRFNKLGKTSVAAEAPDDSTLDEFLARHRFGSLFRDNYLLPMVAAIWSCSVRQAGEFPLTLLLRFFLNHGLLDIRNRPQWYVVRGGSHSYVAPITRPFADCVRLQTPVLSVRRLHQAVEVRCNNGSQQFDQVVFACHSDQALRLLANPTADENAVLAAMSYQDNEVILHCDRAIMPRRRRAWASWNFLAAEQSDNALPMVTYSMNILQGINSTEPLLVSLNARERIDPGKIIRRFNYAHPVHSQGSVAAQKLRHKICGTDHIHYCGAYWYNGFHEDGVRSALDVTRRFGMEL